MMIIIGIILIMIGGILLYATTKYMRNGRNGVFEADPGFYVINEKYYGESTFLKSWVTPNEYAIKEKAITLRTNNELATITKTYDYLEAKYIYATDNRRVFNGDKLVLTGGPDSWDTPLSVLAQRNQNGVVVIDCEDGTLFLVSLLRANNIDAWVNIGIVTVDGVLYGHAWCTVIYEEKEYLLETTIGKPLEKLLPVPPEYKRNFKFNEKEVIFYTGADINNQVYPPLPPGKIANLEKILNSS